MAATLLLAIVVQSAHKDRAKQLERIKQYETGHLEPVVVDEHTMTMSFDAMGQHYEVELMRKTDMAASEVKHTNVEEAVHSAVSMVTESCYWKGRVTNFEGTSIVSASFCEGRGIRARVAAFDEILIIKPSAYYMDLEKDAAMDHSMEDEVLMYRLSDFDRPKIMGTEGVSDYVVADDVEDDEAMRRRLYSSSSPGNTEITVLIGPVRVANYKNDFGTNWYSALYYDTSDMMNAVDSVYDATNWNDNGRSSVGSAGSLRVRFNEIHLIYAFTGSYASMAPTKRFSNCPLGNGQYDDSDECAIVGNDWLGLISNWVYYNMNTGDYDNVQFITDIKFNWNACTGWNGQSYVCSRTLGWGNIGVVCKGSSSVSTNSVVEEFGGNDNAVGTIAHELGHNFGLYHDGQSGPAASCCADCGLMGYGDNHEEFSTCSLDSMRDYFNGNGNGMSCLGSGWSSSDGVTSNFADSGASATPSPTAISSNTPAPVTTPSPVSNVADGECVHIEIGFTNSDGDWDAYANYEYNGQKAYYFNQGGTFYYLYYNPTTWWGTTMKWMMTDSWDTSSPTVYFFCTNDNLLTCSGEWSHWTSSGSYTSYPDSTVSESCTSSLMVDTSCDSYDCLSVAGAGGDYDGFYDASGDCHDGQRVFTKNGYYLCFSDSYNRWMITDSKCTLGSIASAQTTGDAMSPSYWLVNSGGNSYTVSNDVLISDCNGAFTGLECLENNEYDDNLCVSTKDTLWGSDRTFALYDELCANDQPVYHYVVYNASKAVEFGGQTLSEGVEATLYLHYQPQQIYSTDTEETPQWMITVDEISVNYLAKCTEEDLRDCTANKWTVKVTAFDGEDGDVNQETVVGGILQELLDEHMTVTDGSCGTEETAKSSSGTVVAVVVILVVLLCAVGACVWWRMNKNDADVSFNHGGAGSVPTGTGAEEAEPDMEAATVTGHVTSTQD